MRIFRRLWVLMRQRRFETDLAEEMDFHRVMKQRDLEREGLDPLHAQRDARRVLGNTTIARERSRDVWLPRWFQQIGQDLRYAFRTSRKNPGFTAVVILTLAIGIGANTGIFSIAYGILLRPLPYEHADRLVLVEAEHDVRGARQPVRAFFALADLETFRARASFGSTAFYATDVGAFSTSAATERIDFATVSASFFSTVRGRMKLGRPLGPSDDLTPSIVISERLWQRVFGSSPTVIGQSVTLSSIRGDGSQRALWRRTPFTIVGVVDSAFQFPTPQTDVWNTAGFQRTFSPNCCSFLPVARLGTNVTLEQATADVDALATALGATNAAAYLGLRANVVRLHDALVRTARPSLQILLAAVGLVLFVACANVTNLLIARNAARRREMAVRRALGASRGRLIAQSLAESALLAAGGGAAGLVVAAAIVETVRRLAPTVLPRFDAVHVDAPVLAFASATAVAATLVAGVLPALHAARASDALKTGATAAATSAPGGRTRRALVMAELAVSVVLLVGTILLARSLTLLMGSDLGVATNHVATASLFLTPNRELTSAQQGALVSRIVEDLGRRRDIVSVGVGTSLPPNQSRMILTLRGANAIDYQASAIPATPGYFSALGIRLRKGRFFTDADDGDHAPVMIMSADTARDVFGEGDPIGRTRSLPVFRDGRSSRATITLVGVIENVKYSGLDRAADNAIYRPFAQQPWPNVFVVARTTGDPAGFESPLRRQIAAIDPAIAVSAVSPLDDVISDAAAQPRFRAFLLAILAGLGLTLAAVGLYGVVAYAVSQRTSEIGIRIALGARTRGVMGMMIREGLYLAAGGVALGAGGAYILARAMATMLYGIAPTDLVSFVFAAAVLLIVALVAICIPARRAANIDPIVALRCE